LISCIALSLRQKEGISSRKTHFSHALPTKWGQIFGWYFSVAGQPDNFSSSLYGARIPAEFRSVETSEPASEP